MMRRRKKRRRKKRRRRKGGQMKKRRRRKMRTCTRVRAGIGRMEEHLGEGDANALPLKLNMQRNQQMSQKREMRRRLKQGNMLNKLQGKHKSD
jgi:hypothetical protein